MISNVIVMVLLVWFFWEFIMTLAKRPLKRKEPAELHPDPTRPPHRLTEERAGYVTTKLERLERGRVDKTLKP